MNKKFLGNKKLVMLTIKNWSKGKKTDEYFALKRNTQ